MHGAYVVKMNSLKLHKSMELNIQNAMLSNNIVSSLKSVVQKDARLGYHFYEV